MFTFILGIVVGVAAFVFLPLDTALLIGASFLAGYITARIFK